MIQNSSELPSIQEIVNALDKTSNISITDARGIIVYANDKLCQNTKYSREELIGQNHRILKSGFHPPEFYQEMWSTISKGKVWEGDIKNKDKEGNFYWINTVIVPIVDSNGTPHHYISIRTNVSKLYKSHEKINSQLEQIKKLELQKEQYYALVSHELKTPLVPILGYCTMLLDPLMQSNLTDEQIEIIKDIERISHNLKTMILNLLEAQKIEMDMMNFTFDEFRVDGFMHDVYNSFTQIATKKKVRFSVNTSVKSNMSSDRRKIEQVFGNLILNSFDFISDGKGELRITAESQNENILFSVKDNGKGIPKEVQDSLFKKYYQGYASHNRKFGGNGLGLSICKGIVERLGGKIWVESTEGKGACFYFTIPKHQKNIEEIQNGTK